MKIEMTDRKVAQIIEIAERLQEVYGQEIASMVKDLIDKEFINKNKMKKLDNNKINYSKKKSKDRPQYKVGYLRNLMLSRGKHTIKKYQKRIYLEKNCLQFINGELTKKRSYLSNFGKNTMRVLRDNDKKAYDWIQRKTTWNLDRCLPVDYPLDFLNYNLDKRKVVMYIRQNNNTIVQSKLIENFSNLRIRKIIKELIEKEVLEVEIINNKKYLRVRGVINSWKV